MRAKPEEGRLAGMMKGHRQIAVTVACALLLVMTATALGAETYRSRVKRLENLRAQKAHVKQNLWEVQQAKAQTADQLGRVEQGVREARADLAQAQGELQQARQQLAVAKAQYQRALGEFERHKQAFQARVLDIYIDGGETQYLEVLLESTDFFDLTNRAFLCEQLAQADADLFATYKQEKDKCEQAKRDWEGKERRARELENRIAQKKFVLEVAAQRHRQILDSLAQQKQRLERELGTLESESQAIEAMLRGPHASWRVPGRWTGSLTKPVPGPIVSQFGMRFHPILHYSRMHSGIDISAGYGTPIQAAGAGVVIFSGWRRGYGNTVMIAHGSDLVTLYAHCSTLLVSEGQQVRQGQVIARVGSTGLSTGPHLHFEKRIGGRPVNPLG